MADSSGNRFSSPYVTLLLCSRCEVDSFQGHKGISAADAPLIIAYMVDRLGKDLSFVTFRNDPEHRSLPLKDGEPPILDSFRRLLQDDFSLARLVAESAGRR